MKTQKLINDLALETKFSGTKTFAQTLRRQKILGQGKSPESPNTQNL